MTAAPREPGLRIYRLMRLARTLNERLFILNRQGRVSAAISVQGHEAAQVGSALGFEPGRDVFLPYYRDYGVVLALGMTPLEVLLNHCSRAGDPNSQGRSAPCHWGSRRLGIVSHASPVASQIPQAAGIAWALRRRGAGQVAACWFGDGATSEGDWHEGLNFAAVHRLPVVFICENNGYAISVAQARQMAVADVAARASGYGLPGVVVDGADPLAVLAATAEAAARARDGEGPTLIEAKVARLGSHGTDDDDRRYRPREEVAAQAGRDPLPAFRARLVAGGGASAEELDALDAALVAEVREAAAAALAAPYPDPATVLDHVYAGPADG